MIHKNEKHVSIRYNGFNINTTIDADLYKKYSNIVWEEFGIGGIKTDLGRHIAEVVTKFDGRKNGLDSFLDPEHIPEPSLKSTFENKINYLKTQPNDTIHTIMDESYRMWIMCKALLDCDNKKNFDMNYMEAWQRYK